KKKGDFEVVLFSIQEDIMVAKQQLELLQKKQNTLLGLDQEIEDLERQKDLLIDKLQELQSDIEKKNDTLDTNTLATPMAPDIVSLEISTIKYTPHKYSDEEFNRTYPYVLMPEP